MTSQTEQWTKAAHALGIIVQAPATVSTRGRLVPFVALLPDFGGSSGMTADPEWAAIEPFVDALTADGFGYSCVSVGDDDDLREMLWDWGWASSKPKPKWL